MTNITGSRFLPYTVGVTASLLAGGGLLGNHLIRKNYEPTQDINALKIGDIFEQNGKSYVVASFSGHSYKTCKEIKQKIDNRTCEKALYHWPKKHIPDSFAHRNANTQNRLSGSKTEDNPPARLVIGLSTEIPHDITSMHLPGETDDERWWTHNPKFFPVHPERLNSGDFAVGGIQIITPENDETLSGCYLRAAKDFCESESTNPIKKRVQGVVRAIVESNARQ